MECWEGNVRVGGVGLVLMSVCGVCGKLKKCLSKHVGWDGLVGQSVSPRGDCHPGDVVWWVWGEGAVRLQ